MSLLLDALKRAEQEKVARNPPDRAPPPSNTRAGAALELQPIAPAGGSTAPRNESAAAAQLVFQAKTAGGAPRSRGMLWATLGAIAIVAIAAAAYVWYSVRALAPQIAAAPLVRAPLAPVPAAELRVAPAAPAASPAAPGPAAAPPPAASLPQAPEREAAPAETAVARLLREAATSAPPPLTLARSAETPSRVPPEIAAGYEALRQGKLATARRSYAAAVAADPASLDAHLGLATIEAREGNRTAAAGHYRRTLELDPRNATALAGLAALADFSRPEALEAQLRADLAAHPQSAALRFTLGNLYASQGRWREAQAEYFEAHRLDPVGPDILFNLAVSLDHVGQSRLAADFYRRALEAARGQSTQFDPGAAARRLAELR